MTPREQTVAAAVARGLTDKEVAIELGLTPNSVRKYLGHVLAKTHSRNRTQLALSMMRAEIAALTVRAEKAEQERDALRARVMV